MSLRIIVSIDKIKDYLEIIALRQLINIPIVDGGNTIRIRHREFGLLCELSNLNR
jgi:hypothetical protein